MSRGRVRGDSGETLVESLVSVGIAGTIIVTLVGALMLAGSATTILKAEGASVASARSLSKAVTAYRIPSATPWIVNGVCNPALVSSPGGALPGVINAAYTTTNAAGQQPFKDTLSGPPSVTYSMVVAYPDGGQTNTREELCFDDGGGTRTIAVDRSAGEAIISLKVGITVTAKGQFASRDGRTGEVNRVEAEIPATVNAYVYRGLT